MQHQNVTKLIGLLTSIFIVSVVLTAQSQDRFTLKSANGIAFSEFRGYDAWQLIATSQPDDSLPRFPPNLRCRHTLRRQRRLDNLR